MDKDIWNKMYKIGMNHKFKFKTSDLVTAGKVIAVIQGKNGKIYTGISIDMSCHLGMCAERSAVANMFLDGETKIDKLLCVRKNGDLWYPCGACREFLSQIDEDSENIKILVDINEMKVFTLKDIYPNWWHKDKK